MPPYQERLGSDDSAAPRLSVAMAADRARLLLGVGFDQDGIALSRLQVDSHLVAGGEPTLAPTAVIAFSCYAFSRSVLPLPINRFSMIQQYTFHMAHRRDSLMPAMMNYAP